jgi:hypothetical protein
MRVLFIIDRAFVYSQYPVFFHQHTSLQALSNTIHPRHHHLIIGLTWRQHRQGAKPTVAMAYFLLEQFQGNLLHLEAM